MAQAPLALWGGVECTFNRVHDAVVDQLKLTGHAERLCDLDRFYDLGLRALRVPLIWERIETARGVFDWAWADAYMERLRTLGIRPIVGLVHHGSGPTWANFTTPDFVTGLARFAGLVADRYPWVRDWTPVNEPLTTARFGCLYGHWQPHQRQDEAFWNALLTQIEGVAAAMKVVRLRQSGARLVQTEDFGHVEGTEPCADQAAFENLRRYLTWDLLAGFVDQDHALYAQLASAGLGPRLSALAQAPCPADVIGMNHYVTSDRFLDHRLDRYPAEAHGGNGWIAYADVEAVRSVPNWSPRWGLDFVDLAARYDRPVAVTECHLGCSADEQVAWLAQCWNAAETARRSGTPVEAVTVWSLVGSAGWDRLLRGPQYAYEAGAFDVSDGTARPTALANCVRALATGAAVIPDVSGWWRNPRRLIFHADADLLFASARPLPELV